MYIEYYAKVRIKFERWVKITINIGRFVQTEKQTNEFADKYVAAFYTDRPSQYNALHLRC